MRFIEIFGMQEAYLSCSISYNKFTLDKFFRSDLEFDVRRVAAQLAALLKNKFPEMNSEMS